MKNQLTSILGRRGNKINSQSIDLCYLIKQLSKDLLPKAVGRKSIILNDISEGMSVHSDKELLAPIIWSMMNDAIDRSANSCIRISAGINENLVTISVNDTSLAFDDQIIDAVRKVQKLAEKLGGSLCLDTNPGKGTTLVFTLFHAMAS